MYYQIWSNPPIISQDIEHTCKHNSKINQGSDLAHLQPKPLLPDINVHAKFEENRSKTTQEAPTDRRTDGRMDGQTDRHSNGSEGIK